MLGQPMACWPLPFERAHRNLSPVAAAIRAAASACAACAYKMGELKLELIEQRTTFRRLAEPLGQEHKLGIGGFHRILCSVCDGVAPRKWRIAGQHPGVSRCSTGRETVTFCPHRTSSSFNIELLIRGRLPQAASSGSELTWSDPSLAGASLRVVTNKLTDLLRGAIGRGGRHRTQAGIACRQKGLGHGFPGRKGPRDFATTRQSGWSEDQD